MIHRYSDYQIMKNVNQARAAIDWVNEWTRRQEAERLLAAVCVNRPIIQGSTQELVYYIRRESDRCVKIGRSTNVIGRLRVLQREHGWCYVIATEVGSSALEAARHRQFQHLRRDGEWFNFSPDLINHVVAVLGGS